MSDLSRYHNKTVRALGADDSLANFSPDSAGVYDLCSDLVEDFMTAAGILFATTDKLGVSAFEDVRTLLLLALFRCPELQNFFQEVIDNQ